ncbi:hypothetical protein [Gordonia sihwensis]|uniref:hypothetical protein n=1 Tax=Gordonia sihwensis TaxID=173559 RepID=UPI003D96095B
MTEQLTPSEVAELMEMLDNGRNLFGQLAPDLRARLSAAADNPSQITWDGAYSIVLTEPEGKTLWQALLEHTDYNITSRGIDALWPVYPTKEQILHALRAELTPTRE